MTERPIPNYDPGARSIVCPERTVTTRKMLVVVASTIAVMLSFALAAPVAYACTEPELTVHDDAVAAGDVVPFTVSNTEPGASFGLGIEDWTASFTDTDGEQGYRGSFTMPDLGGSSRTIYVQFTGTHDEQTFAAHGKQLQYVVAAPAPTPGSGTGSEVEEDVEEDVERPDASHEERRSEDRTPTRSSEPAPQVVQPQPGHVAARDVGDARSGRGADAGRVARRMQRVAPVVVPSWKTGDPEMIHSADNEARVQPSVTQRRSEGRWLWAAALVALALALLASRHRPRRRPTTVADVTVLVDGSGDADDRAA